MAKVAATARSTVWHLKGFDLFDGMAARDLDLVLLSTPENIFYLTGLDHWGYFAPHLLLVPAEDQMVLMATAEPSHGVVGSTEAEGRRLETYLKLSGIGSGLWVNFNVEDLRTAMRRLVIPAHDALAGDGGIGAGWSRN